MKTLILFCLLCFLSTTTYSQSETQLKAQLKKDPVFIKYNKARLDFLYDAMGDKWGYKDADKAMIKHGRKNVKNYNDLKKLYIKAGVDPGYLVAYNNMRYAQLLVAKKYRAVIKSNPAMFKKVTKELTSSIHKSTTIK